MVDCSMVTTVLVTIATGMLLIDLSPLQENMVCSTGYTNASTCPEVFFAQSYHAARMKFKKAANEAGAEWRSHVVFQEDGFYYTTDTAFLRGRQSNKLLVHMSGTHGVDGFTGSALQVKLLREWNKSRDDGPSVLFVHAVNPHGMAHLRRYNEKNVDLGHNFLSPEEWVWVLNGDSNSSARYDETVASLIMPKAPRFIDRYLSLFHLMKGVVLRGFGVLKQFLSLSQYHHPDGVGFGGHDQQQGITILRQILTTYAKEGVAKSIVLDVRTGLGSEGSETIVTNSREEAEDARAIFTVARVEGKREDAELKGEIKPRVFFGNNTLFVKEYFGTINSLFVARALLLENAAYNYAKGSHVHAVTQEWLRDAFYPQTMNYKRTVLRKGVNTFDSAWNNLSRG